MGGWRISIIRGEPTNSKILVLLPKPFNPEPWTPEPVGSKGTVLLFGPKEGSEFRELPTYTTPDRSPLYNDTELRSLAKIEMLAVS